MERWWVETVSPEGAPSKQGQERGRSGERTARLLLAIQNPCSTGDVTVAEALSSEGLDCIRPLSGCDRLLPAPSSPVLLKPQLFWTLGSPWDLLKAQAPTLRILICEGSGLGYLQSSSQCDDNVSS